MNEIILIVCFLFFLLGVIMVSYHTGYLKGMKFNHKLWDPYIHLVEKQLKDCETKYIDLIKLLGDNIPQEFIDKYYPNE